MCAVRMDRGDKMLVHIVAKKLLPRMQAGFVPESPPDENPFVLWHLKEVQGIAARSGGAEVC